MIPPSGFLRRVVITIVAVLALLGLGLIFTYDLIKVNWVSTMEDQVAVEAQQGPRVAAAAEALSFDDPSRPASGELLANPIPPDEVSLQRGSILYGINCALCHGDSGRGDGPVVARFAPDARPPADLTATRLATQSDGALYLTISQGFGTMPPLRENLTPRERWDVVNYVRTLAQ